MSELKTYVCPNCGANTTNPRNCEYCGSILVRFVEKGIDISQTIYTDNTEVFPGLIPELERNLKLQEMNPNHFVATEIIKLQEDGSTSSISIYSNFTWNDGTIPSSFNFGQTGLRIGVTFPKYLVEGQENFNSRMDAELERFRQLASFPLFSSHFCSYTDTWGYARVSHEYAIDCGQDIEITARLVSDILINVEGWSLTDSFDIMTNVGDDVYTAHKAWGKAHGFVDDSSSAAAAEVEEEDKGDDYQWLWIGIAIISIICSLLGVIS